MVQRLTPDDLRGRVGAVELLVGMTGPDIGNFSRESSRVQRQVRLPW